jgi:hypothetical protein
MHNENINPTDGWTLWLAACLMPDAITIDPTQLERIKHYLNAFRDHTDNAQMHAFICLLKKRCGMIVEDDSSYQFMKKNDGLSWMTLPEIQSFIRTLSATLSEPPSISCLKSVKDYYAWTIQPDGAIHISYALYHHLRFTLKTSFSQRLVHLENSDGSYTQGARGDERTTLNGTDNLTKPSCNVIAHDSNVRGNGNCAVNVLSSYLFRYPPKIRFSEQQWTYFQHIVHRITQSQNYNALIDNDQCKGDIANAMQAIVNCASQDEWVQRFHNFTIQHPETHMLYPVVHADVFGMAVRAFIYDQCNDPAVKRALTTVSESEISDKQIRQNVQLAINQARETSADWLTLWATISDNTPQTVLTDCQLSQVDATALLNIIPTLFNQSVLYIGEDGIEHYTNKQHDQWLNSKANQPEVFRRLVNITNRTCMDRKTEPLVIIRQGLHGGHYTTGKFNTDHDAYAQFLNVDATKPTWYNLQDILSIGPLQDTRSVKKRVKLKPAALKPAALKPTTPKLSAPKPTVPQPPAALKPTTPKLSAPKPLASLQPAVPKQPAKPLTQPTSQSIFIPIVCCINFFIATTLGILLLGQMLRWWEIGLPSSIIGIISLLFTAITMLGNIGLAPYLKKHRIMAITNLGIMMLAALGILCASLIMLMAPPITFRIILLTLTCFAILPCTTLVAAHPLIGKQV